MNTQMSEVRILLEQTLFRLPSSCMQCTIQFHSTWWLLLSALLHNHCTLGLDSDYNNKKVLARHGDRQWRHCLSFMGSIAALPWPYRLHNFLLPSIVIESWVFLSVSEVKSKRCWYWQQAHNIVRNSEIKRGLSWLRHVHALCKF